MRGESVTVGPPYYDFFLRAFGLPLLLLMGIGPLIAWRRASLRALRPKLALAGGVALVAGVVLLVARRRVSSVPGLVAYTFSAFVLAAIALEFARGTRARHALGAGSWPRAFSASSGGTAGATAATSCTRRSCCSRRRRRLGASDDAGGEARAGPVDAGRRLHAHVPVAERAAAAERDGDPRDAGRLARRRRLGTLRAGKNRYAPSSRSRTRSAIRTDWLAGEDLFVIADQINPDGTVYFKVLVKPLVNLIWLAGLVFVAGSLITLWPDAREQRRLAARFAEAALARATR